MTVPWVMDVKVNSLFPMLIHKWFDQFRFHCGWNQRFWVQTVWLTCLNTYGLIVI